METRELKVDIPALLMHCTDGKRTVMVRATTLKEALRNLFVDYPLLKVHLLDESGQPRAHVLFFYNQENTRWLERLDIQLTEGDQLTILQAVTGG